MKTYTLKNVSEHDGKVEHDRGYRLFSFWGGDDMEVSDGFHTMDELYEHRNILFIALCRNEARGALGNVWRSQKHSDGTMFDGSFILGIGKEKDKQITYHLPAQLWDETEFAETLETAPEFDGHTPKDVLVRLKQN